MRAWSLGCCALALVACGGGDAVIGDGGNGGDGANPNGDGGNAVDSGGGGDGGASDSGDLDSGSANDGAAVDSGADSGVLGGRLFVSMGNAAPGVWDKVSTVSSDVAPTFTLSSEAAVTAGTRGVGLAGDRLFFGAESMTNTLVGFAAASSLNGGATAALKIPASQFVSPMGIPVPQLVQWDAKTDALWVSGFGYGTQMFAGASTLTSMSKAKALFTHAWGQLPAAAYDPTGDRLFLGQISGAGVLAFSSASAATGTPAVGYTLEKNDAAWSAAIDKDRLYAIGPFTSNGGAKESIAVWKGISGVSAAKAPDFTMTAPSGLAQSDFSPWITVQSDVLIACVQAGKVLLWTQASSLNGEKAPTQTIAIGSPQNPPKKALLGRSGRLYVLDSTGVSIYANPTTSPTLVTKLTMGMSKPQDMALLD